MSFNIRKLIKETIESELLCEVKIEIDDVKHRGFAEQLGQIYKRALASLDPLKIYGKIGVKSSVSSEDASVFEITLANGDVIQALRNTNPAFGIIKINNGEDHMIYSNELFSNNFPELIKKYYLQYKTAKAGMPSI